MSNTVVLKAEKREKVGSKHASKLRQKGRIPAVVYGHKLDPVSISIDKHEFVENLHHGHRVFNINVDKSKDTLLVKDLQYDHLGKEVVHVDFVRVDLAETVKVTVPIELRGTAKGSHEGGIVDEHLDHLEIECKVNEIPETIPVLIKELGVGDTIHAGDIELASGLKLATDPSAVVLTCHLVAAAKTTEEMEEEMPTAPEVITERAEEPESESE